MTVNRVETHYPEPWQFGHHCCPQLSQQETPLKEDCSFEVSHTN